MATAIIGAGSIGRAVATDLAAGGEAVLLAGRDVDRTADVAAALGPNVTALDIRAAIDRADAVVFAVWFDAIKELAASHGDLLDGKVVLDPSNPVAQGEDGQFARTLPDGVSAASVNADAFPPGAHFVKAFGTVVADTLVEAPNSAPRTALFYATDDDLAGEAAERLITLAGFEAVSAGGLDAAIWIEMFGALHQFGGLDGRRLSGDEARAAAAKVTA